MVQDFRIGPLDSFWLPAAYRPGRVDLAGARVNAESLTLLTEKESAAGLAYPAIRRHDVGNEAHHGPTQFSPSGSWITC